MPFALLYGLIIALRNYLYNKKILRSIQLSIPSIAIGNLTVGGSGKTPHIEYLIELLQHDYKVATLSRGYKRQTKGFLLASDNDSARTIGDEPMQFKYKFPSVSVAVCEERLLAIPNLIAREPTINVILLDDAFQHRSIKPGINILLTEYDSPYFKDYIVPFGNLRESKHGACRADIIVVSKCPVEISPKQKKDFIEKIKPLKHQEVFFSTIKYKEVYNYFTQQTIEFTNKDVILVAGIANPQYLYYYIKSKANSVHLLKYKDHFYFEPNNINDILEAYDNLKSDHKIIVTTEKDATRLILHRETFNQRNIHFCVLPIQIDFLFEDKEKFNSSIRKYLAASNYDIEDSQFGLSDIEVIYEEII